MNIELELPFELYKYHKSTIKLSWKRKGLIVSPEEFESIYYMYIYTKNCELCNKEFSSSLNRHMEHNHATGEFRNIVCNSCNLLKSDRKKSSNNTSGYTGIFKEIDNRYKQGFRWVFEVRINGKRKKIKSSTDKEKVIEFATKWKIDNNYHT